MVLCGLLLAAPVHAQYPSVPKETFEALNIDRSASPKEFHEALTKRWLDPGRGAGKGQYGQYWEPIAMSKYFDPMSFYKPPTSVKEVATREQCVKCHTDESPGWVAMWKRSTHANLDKIRKLTPNDDTFYKKAKLEEVETNLRSIGKLGPKENLKEVSCIDCHVGINTKNKADHRVDIKMTTSDVCGNCHLLEYAERESERDTILWPKNQWPRGRPSHALDYRANVETDIYAGMSQREIADGCTMCHTNQNKCDNCHTRHEFSVADSRKPEACGTCHSGADHNNYEAYNASQHGLGYQASKGRWNFNVQLKDAVLKGGQKFPTCQSCHMEYQGKFTHNTVRKVRWANYPFVPGIREPVFGEWGMKRLDAWVKTCTTCHSETFARSWLEFMDNGTSHGLDKYDEAHNVVHKQYEARLLTGQKNNRPAPPAPAKALFDQFWQIYWSKNNSPTAIELKLFEMAEDHLVQLHVALAHQYPGYTYTVGWAAMNRAYVEIMDEDTKLKERMVLMERVSKLEQQTKTSSLLDFDTTDGKFTLGSLGGGMLLTGTLALAGWSRRKKNQR
ncbi:MAG: hydroxylamine reductase [Nitrospira sp. CG24B]|nr:MAG: hydroxylamine reductase [Nitrospira sp. CG24B]